MEPFSYLLNQMQANIYRALKGAVPCSHTEHFLPLAYPQPYLPQVMLWRNVPARLPAGVVA